MLPFGPQSSVDTTISPTSHSISRMNAPIMTIAGRRRRLYISQNSIKMNDTVRAPTVMKYGKYLPIFEISLLLDGKINGVAQLEHWQRARNVPWYPQEQPLLRLDEDGEDAHDAPRSEQHGEDPQVQRERRPIVGPHA